MVEDDSDSGAFHEYGYLSWSGSQSDSALIRIWQTRCELEGYRGEGLEFWTAAADAVAASAFGFRGGNHER